MNNRILLGLVIALLVAGFVVALPRYLPTANAATGLVCLGDPSSAAVATATPCPSSPTFSGPIGNYLKVGVLIQGSDALNGFDIVLKTDHTKLQPLDATLDNTLLPGATTVIVKCIAGVLVAGSACPATDTIDTIEFAVTAGLGQITTPPTSGLLFNAIFNITGTGTSTIIYPSGCGNAQTPTSVPPSTCITISNGTPSPVSETAQTASFDNTTPPPNLTLSAVPTSIPSPGASVITVASHNGWPPIGATDSIAFTTIAPSHVNANAAPAQCTPSIPCITTLSVSGTGNGPVQVLGTYQTASSSGQTETLIAATTVIVLVPQNFVLAVSPTTITTNPATATVTITTTGGFNTPVVLSLGASLPSTGLIACFSPTTVTGAGTSMVTFVGTAGTYSAQIKGTAGSMIKTSALLHVTVPAGAPSSCAASGGDFTLSANPTSVSGTVNTPATSTITVTPTNGFTGNVVLTVTPATCSITPATVNGGSGTATLTCTATAAGTFNAVVTGASGSLSHTQTVGFTITSPGGAHDFTVTASPTTVPVTAGQSGTSTITVTGLNGITGTVTLSSTVTPTTGLTCQLSSTSITLGTTPGTSTLTCNAASTASGAFTVDIAGSNTTVTKHATVTFTVTPAGTPSFTLTPDQTSVSCSAGQQKTVTITAAAQGGFTGTIVLAAPVITGGTTGGLTGTLSVSSITGGAGTSTLTLNCVTAGNYNVAVTGTSGTLSPVTANVSVSVSAGGTPGFTLSATPMTLTCTNAAGQTGTSTISATNTGGFNGNIALTVQALPPGLTASLSPTSISGSQTSTLTVSCAGATAGSYTATVRGTNAYLESSVAVTITVTNAAAKDFAIMASPSSVTFTAGSTGMTTISISPVNGYSENVLLSLVSSPAGLTGTFSPTSVSGGSGSSTLTFNSSTAGTYTVTVTGTGETKTHSTTVTVVVAPAGGQGTFAISASPSSVTCSAGGTASSTVTVTSQNGFTGTVTLHTPTVTPATGLTVTLSTTTVMNGMGSSTLSLACTVAGTYTIAVTGTSGSQSQTATVTATVTQAGTGSFTVSISPSHITVLQGCENVTTVNLTSQGFSGTLDLSVKVSPVNAGVHADLSKIHTSLKVDATNHLVLTISADAGATVGSYTVTVTASHGSTSHSATLNVTVLANHCTSGGDDNKNNEGCGSQGSGHDDDDNVCTGSNDKNNVNANGDDREGTVQKKVLTGSCGSSDDNDDNTTSGCSCPSILGNENNDNQTGDKNNENQNQQGQHGTSDQEQNKCQVTCVSGNEDHGSKGTNDNSDKNQNNQKAETGQRGVNDQKNTGVCSCGCAGQTDHSKDTGSNKNNQVQEQNNRQSAQVTRGENNASNSRHDFSDTGRCVGFGLDNRN